MNNTILFMMNVTFLMEYQMLDLIQMDKKILFNRYKKKKDFFLIETKIEKSRED